MHRQCVCNICAMFMQCICIFAYYMFAIFMECICNMCVQRNHLGRDASELGNVCATYVQGMCNVFDDSVCAMYVQCMCNVHKMYVQCMFNMCVQWNHLGREEEMHGQADGDGRCSPAMQ